MHITSSVVREWLSHVFIATCHLLKKFFSYIQILIIKKKEKKKDFFFKNCIGGFGLFVVITICVAVTYNSYGE